MDKKPSPYFFTSIPRKEVDRIMAKKTGSKRRPQLTSLQIKTIAEEWDKKTPDQIAEMLGSTTSTINNFAREIRKQTKGRLCSARGGKGIKRSDLVATALSMLEE